jgi:outer membrane immunogenic protein
MKVLLAAVAAIAASISIAAAADLPNRVATPETPPEPQLTWTGFYVGGQFGYAMGVSRSASYNTATGASLSSPSAAMNGDLGGAHIGYLFSAQSFPVLTNIFGGNGNAGTSTVMGIEGDVDGTSAAATYPLLTHNVTNSAQENVQGSIRGRLGVAFGPTLVYGTGGIAIGDISSTFRNATGGSDSADHTKAGYTVGGGVEYAFLGNLSVRAEYRFTDFGSVTDSLVNSTAGTVTVSHKQTDSRVMLGFSYRFDNATPASVVARY